MSAADKKLIELSLKRFEESKEREQAERAKMLDDLKFRALDQWPADLRNNRENDPNGGRPCLTIDKCNQYINQVVNDMRQNRPSVKVRPVDDIADPEVADVFQGIIRHIEDTSNADVAYETAGESAITIGQGYFRIVTEYTDPQSFDQDICIKRIVNPWNVFLGPHLEPDGSDAQFGHVFEDMPEEQFKAKYPKAKTQQSDFDSDGVTDWRTQKTIRVAEYLYIEDEPATIVQLDDGRTMLQAEYAALPQDSYTDPMTGAVISLTPAVIAERPTKLQKVRWCKHTAAEVLEKRDWAGRYIPIIQILGNEVWIDGKRQVWGLIRPAKDSLRMYNYWASTVTEKIALSPKAPFVGVKGAFDGLEDRWEQANRVNYAYLEYNPVDVNGNPAPAPQRQPPAPIEVAIMQQMQLIEHDVQSALGMYKASLGDQAHEQSGRAVLALQKEGDTSTFHYQDNVSRGIKYCGRQLIDLIPKIYDQRRIARIIGEDGTPEVARLSPDQQEPVRKVRTADGKIQKIYNLGVGTYDVTSSVGPSYTSKRQEGAAAMLQMAQGDPELKKIAGDLMFRSFDFPYADQIADRLKKLLPPQLQDAPDGQEQLPPEIQAKAAQLDQGSQMLQQRTAMLAEAEQKIRAEGQKVAGESAQLDAQRKELEAERKVLVAEFKRMQAELKANQMDSDSQAEGVAVNAMMQIEQRQTQLLQAVAARLDALEQVRMQDGEGIAHEREETRQITTIVAQAVGQISQQIENARPVSVVTKRDQTGRIVGGTATYANGEQREITIQ